MNNAFAAQQEEIKDPKVIEELVKMAEEKTKIVEALYNIANSDFWKVIERIFDADLDKARRSLAKERDTTEMFRLQGDIRSLEKYNLEKMFHKYRSELETITKKIQ